MIAKLKQQINPFSSIDERKKYKVIFIYLAKWEIEKADYSFGVYDGSSIIILPKRDIDIFQELNDNLIVRFPGENEIDKNYSLIIGDEAFIKDGNLSDYIDYRYNGLTNEAGKNVTTKLEEKYLSEVIKLNSTH